MADGADPGEPGAREPDVRFSLANERTLLAYQRTGIGLMAASIAVGHFFGDGLLVQLLAVALLLTGVVAVVGGYWHFRRTDEAIRAGRPMGSGPATHGVTVGLLVCLALAAFVLLRA